ncbi:MAG: PAS domain-containing protein [Desulfocucumaceae bacterium]
MKKIINRTMLNYKILFAVVTMCLITGAVVLYRYESKTLIQDGHTHLIQTADMKALLLSNWIKERNNDAFMIMKNTRLSSDLYQWLNNRNMTSNKNMVADRIKIVNHSGTYDAAALLDKGGNVIMPISGIVEDLDALTKKKAVQSAVSGNIMWDDLYYCEDCKKEEVNIFVPLYASEKTGSKTIAVLLLQVDAKKYLIPLIRTRPEPRKTNEILLLRTEELDRFIKAKYFNSSFSDDTPLDRAVMLNPESSLIGEFEYHNTKVLAAFKKIPDMPWYIVATVANEEAYASLRILTLTIASSLIFLITLLGSLIALVVSNQKKDLYKRQYDIEIEQKALIKHYDYISKYSNDIFFLIEEGGRIVQFNDRALTAYGFSNDEIIGMKVFDFGTERAMTNYESTFKKAIENGGTLFETEHKCKDGKILPVEISLRNLEIEGKRYFQAIIRDITDRKKNEEALKASEQQKGLILNSVPVAIYIAPLAAQADATWISGNVKGVTGFSAGEYLSQPDFWRKRLHPEDRDMALKAFEDAKEKGDGDIESGRGLK